MKLNGKGPGVTSEHKNAFSSSTTILPILLLKLCMMSFQQSNTVIVEMSIIEKMYVVGTH